MKNREKVKKKRVRKAKVLKKIKKIKLLVFFFKLLIYTYTLFF